MGKIEIDLSGLPNVMSPAFYEPLMKNDKRFNVLKGGAGSGKSYFKADKHIYRLITEQADGFQHRILGCRKVANTIRKSMYNLIKGRAAAIGLYGLFKFKDSLLEIECLNGNKMMFAGLDDVEKLKSIYDPTSIWLEEASEATEEDIDQLNLRLRGRFPFKKEFDLTFNPISYGSFLRAKFFTDTPRADTLIHESTYHDNPFIDEEYVAQLESMKDTNPYYYQVYVLNQWGSAAGACFPEFTNGKKVDEAGTPIRAWTHVILPFEIPHEWKIYRSFDFGYSRPFSVGWWAVDYDGRMYRILELYGCTGEPNVGIKWHPQQIADRIKEIEDSHRWLKGKTIQGVADPSIWDASRGDSVADVMEKTRIYFEPADNKRIPGKMQVHYRLAFDENGIPMIYFFDTCKAAIRTFPELIYDEHKPEDVDTDGEDHCLTGDTLVCTSNGRTAISELCGTEGLVYGHDGMLHEYTDCRMTRKSAEVFTVEFEDGSRVSATANHRFMLANGTWKRLDELKPDDDVMRIEV